jgi:hypothetical protein
VLPDNIVGVPPTATAVASSSFDPWDMPYFGAATYFSYQATFGHAEGSGRDRAVPSATNRVVGSLLPFDPWDAPYFGGRVYLSYSPALADCAVPPPPALLSAYKVVSIPSNLQAEPAPGGDAIENGAGEQMPAISGPDGHRKRTWWTRLFRQS